jgi:hypothetical protein
LFILFTGPFCRQLLSQMISARVFFDIIACC